MMSVTGRCVAAIYLFQFHLNAPLNNNFAMSEVNLFQLKVCEILISSQQVAHLFGAGLTRMKKTGKRKDPDADIMSQITKQAVY